MAKETKLLNTNPRNGSVERIRTMFANFQHAIIRNAGIWKGWAQDDPVKVAGHVRSMVASCTKLLDNVDDIFADEARRLSLVGKFDIDGVTEEEVLEAQATLKSVFDYMDKAPLDTPEQIVELCDYMLKSVPEFEDDDEKVWPE